MNIFKVNIYAPVNNNLQSADIINIYELLHRL